MTISYPLDMPTLASGSRRPARIFMGARDVVGISESPFTMQQQVQVFTGGGLGLECTLPSQNRAEADPWIAFLLALQGVYGTFRYGDPFKATPRGSAPGTPVVNGAGQVGRSLATSGWTASQSGILLRGDHIQIGDYL